MLPVGRDVLQRPQDESAPVHLRMRQDQLSMAAMSTRTTHAPASVVDNIDVQWTRRHAWRELPAGSTLQALNETQQCARRLSGAHGKHCIEVARLPSATDRSSHVEAGALHYFEALRFEFAAGAQQGGMRFTPAPMHVRAKRKLYGVNLYGVTNGAVYPHRCEAFCHARHYCKNCLYALDCKNCLYALGNCSLNHYVSY
jgi:hypothetical protein